jgi:Zn-dependent peptidase ImmA (M78 family)
MDSIDLRLREVVESAVKSSIDFEKEIELNSSLMDVYQKRKWDLNLSDRQIQIILGMDKKTLMPILDGTAKHVNFINILKLAHFFGLSVNDLIKLYIPQMDSKSIGEIQRSREAGYIIEYFDISTLTKMKFFEKDSSSAEMAKKIQSYFGLDILFDYSKSKTFTAFSRSKRKSDDLMRYFWVQSAIAQFSYINNPYIYNRQALLDLIPKIRPYTRDVKNGLIKVLKALSSVGVTVLFQPSVEKLQVRGATMSVNNKPCIVLSDVHKNYPTLWFALLHELHHVLFDFEEIEKRVYHISSAEGDLFLMDEEKADNFARDFLLNESRLKYASGYIQSPYHIEKMAQEWSVHPSIIYSFYCYKTEEWNFYSKYIPKMDEALELLNTHPFEKESLFESAKEIKELLNL